VRILDLVAREGLELRISTFPHSGPGDDRLTYSYMCRFWGPHPRDQVMKRCNKFVESAQGFGSTPMKALRSYVDNIRGQRMVIVPDDQKKKREFQVPNDLRC
jgi:hypothetical protein